MVPCGSWAHTRAERASADADPLGRKLTARRPSRLVILTVLVSALGVVVIATTIGTSEAALFILIASGWVFGVGLAVIIGFSVADSGLFRVSLSRSRRAPRALPSEVRFDSSVIGVGVADAPFSYVQFWQLGRSRVIAMYLRPRWPHLPLRIDEDYVSLEDALTSEFGRRVLLLRQGQYSEAVAQRHFRVTPEPLDKND